MITAREAKALTMDNEATTELPIWFGQIEEAIYAAAKVGKYCCMVRIDIPPMPKCYVEEQATKVDNYLTDFGYKCAYSHYYDDYITVTFNIGWNLA